MFPLEDGEGWYYIAEGTWDLLGTDPLAPDMRVREEGRTRMVGGADLNRGPFGLCDLTHLSVRVGLYLHPRGMLAIQSLRLPPPFRRLGSMVSSPPDHLIGPHLFLTFFR